MPRQFPAVADDPLLRAYSQTDPKQAGLSFRRAAEAPRHIGDGFGFDTGQQRVARDGEIYASGKRMAGQAPLRAWP